MKLTEKAIERLKVSPTRCDIRDDKTTGLYLRVLPTGRKVWRYRYQLRGKTRILTLGDWKDPRRDSDADSCLSLTEARAEAGKYRLEVINGNDPAANMQKAESERRAMPTVKEFVSEYIERYAKPNKKSWHQDELILERWVVPKIGLLRMNEVSRRDIVKIIDDCRDTGNIRQPGKVLAATRMLFKFAIQRGVLDSTPCMYIAETQPEPAQKAMTADEIKLWWNKTGKAIESDEPEVHKPTALALRLLLLTGQRPGEVANMTRDELYLDSPFGAHWIIAGERRKKGRAKKGKPHAVALEPEAVAVIEAALALSNSEYVFEKVSGGPIRTDSGLSAALGRLFGAPPRPTPHAARHTVASELEDLGIDEYHIGRVLGHGAKTVTGTVYMNRRINEQALQNQRTLLSSWENRLLKIVHGKRSSKVTNIAEQRA